MKKSLVFLVCVLVSLQSQLSAQSSANITTQQQRSCGFQRMYNARIAKDPSFADSFAAQKGRMQAIADDYIAQQINTSVQKTTSISAVPVIFHIAVDSAQLNQLGGISGIKQRCDSQIAVLNRDYNRQNADSTGIPSSWKSLYGNPGIKFALATKDPDGNCSPGYEVKIISGNTTTDGGFADESPYNGYYTAAKTSATGLAAWDNTKYYNVWCINFTDDNGLLGITTPLSFTSGSDGAPLEDEGVCILYYTLGCIGQDGTIPAGTGSWNTEYALGRTLTHETGHFFEIWHPWGDDGPGSEYPGYCPWANSHCSAEIGSDDGLSDTPPEQSATYNNPTYTITGGTITDCCDTELGAATQPIGIACLSYMDYTDDVAMHLFTNMQAAVMASMVLIPATGGISATGKGGHVGENYNLTQNPDLTAACTITAVTITPAIKTDLNVFPNPTTGEVTLTLNSSADVLNQIIITNLLGQQVMSINGQNKDYYSIDLSGMSKGIYFIKCNFASGSITRKISLQ